MDRAVIVSLASVIASVMVLGASTWMSFKFSGAIRSQEQATLDRYKAMEGDSGQRERDVATARERVMALEQEVSAARARAAALEQAVATAQGRSGTLEQEVSAARGRTVALEQEVTTARERAAALEQEVAKAQGRTETLEQEVSTAQGRSGALEQEVSTARGRTSALEQDVSTARERTTALEREVSTARARTAALEQEVAAARERAVALEKEASTARDRAAAFEQAAREANERAARMTPESPPPSEKAPVPQFDAAEIQQRLAALGKLVKEAGNRTADPPQPSAAATPPAVPAQAAPEAAPVKPEAPPSPIVASLRKYAGAKAAIYVLHPVTDAPASGAAISAYLSEAGWAPGTWTWTGVAGIFGVVVLVKDGSDAATNEAATALVEALRAAGFNATKGDWPASWHRFRGMLDGPQTPGPTDAPIRIAVGAKPR